jgi:hypothetical protein
LTKIRETLKGLGYDTHLPHEDVARWKKDTVNNSDAFLKNLEEIDCSNILLGIVDEASRGAYRDRICDSKRKRNLSFGKGRN